MIIWSGGKFLTGPKILIHRGSYSYSTLQTTQARSVLIEPIEDTLYFAGEALYEGTEMGTVEAALTSGNKVADIILSVKNKYANF